MKRILNYIKNSIYFYRFLNHIFIHLRCKSEFKKNKKHLLVEFNSVKPSLLTTIYLIKYLSEKHNSSFCVFNSNIPSSSYRYFKNFISVIFQIKCFLIYYFLNFKKFIFIKPIKKNLFKNENDIIYDYNNLKSRTDLENYKIDDILIGDLIYDDFLRKNFLPTIDLKCKKFKGHFINGVKNYYYWKDYFKRNKIEALILTHPVYFLAIPLRLAQKNEIPVYFCLVNQIEYFNSERGTWMNPKYKNSFKQLNPDKQKKILKITKKKIQEKFDPKKNEYAEKYMANEWDIPEDKLNTFSSSTKKQIFPNNSKPNVVIFSHCLYDASHWDGKFLFPDFYQWLKYLYKLSNELDYNWFIKPHPHTLSKSLNSEVLKSLSFTNPNLKILDNDVTNDDLLKNNVSLILTSSGSAAYEFSYYNIPSILAGNKNRYENYKFSYHPKNLEDYEDAIKNFKKIKYINSKEDIYEFYYNLYLATWDFLKNYEDYIVERKKFFSDEIFQFYLKDFNTKWKENKFEEIDEFIKNKYFQLCSDVINL